MYREQIEYVQIPESSLNVINQKLEELNYGITKGKLKRKKVLLIFGFILNKILNANEEQLDRGYLPIYHKSLEKQYYKHYKCTQFLVENKILQRLNYSNQNGKSNRYALHNDYLYDNLIRIVISKPDITQENYFKAIYMDRSVKKYKHLIDHFKGICFDYSKAKLQLDNEFSSGNLSRRKYLVHKSAISSINNKLFYFRNADTDKRLHTNLTKLPKRYRKFLCYKGKPLVNLDIKNSQPYFLAVIINIILNKDQLTLDKLKPVLKRVKSKKASKPTNYYAKISELFNADFDKKELLNYINSVCNGSYYELLIEKLEPYLEYENGILIKKKYDKKAKVTLKKTFESKRDYAKDSSMLIFFASQNSTIKDITFFKNEFPAIWELTRRLKCNESSNFAALLQNLEAHLILNKITKEANKRFKAPTFTIHDSIATTHEYIDDIKKLTLKILSSTFNLTPKIDIENWF